MVIIVGPIVGGWWVLVAVGGVWCWVLIAIGAVHGWCIVVVALSSCLGVIISSHGVILPSLWHGHRLLRSWSWSVVVVIGHLLS